MNQTEESRRAFLKKATVAAFAFPLLMNCKSDTLAQKSNESVLDLMRKNADLREDCGNWCGSAREAPNDVSWKAILADEKDAGEPLLISGTVYEKDGKTPAPNILIYAYHTNAKGFYGRGKGEHPHGKHHGWMLTDERGRYEFRTIKPEPYPLRDTPAHIHFTLTGINFKEYWIDDIWFEGDDLITPEIKKKQLTGRGGFNSILSLEKSTDGVLRGVRNIKLGTV
jgi:protocatechuate 3,4-dioxygenase beta subunit